MSIQKPSPLGFEQLDRLRAGDKDAFTDLVREHGPRMLAFARRFLPRDQDAHDALQDAFLSAFKSIGKFDGRSQLSTWLQRITINACLMRIRSRKRRPEVSIEALLPAFLPDGHQIRDTPAWGAESKVESGHETEHGAGSGRGRLLDLVRESVDGLPDAYREVLLLRDVEEFSTEETAEALGITKDAVKTRLHRARQALRAMLEPSFCTRGDEQ